MKERTKGYFAGVVTTVLAVSLIGSAMALQQHVVLTAEYSDIKIKVNDEYIVPKDSVGNVVEPFSVNGTVYLPARAIANAVGYDVGWNGVDTVILAPNRFLSTEEKVKLGYSALNRTYGSTDIPRLDNYIGQAAFYDCISLDENAHAYLYDPAYSKYEGYTDMMDRYSMVLNACDYIEQSHGKYDNGDEYHIYFNKETKHQITTSELTAENGTTFVVLTMEFTNGKSANGSSHTNSSSNSTSNSSQDASNGSMPPSDTSSSANDSAKEEAYRQAYIDKRMAEKAAHDKYGPGELPESAQQQIDTNYQNALNQIERQYGS